VLLYSIPKSKILDEPSKAMLWNWPLSYAGILFRKVRGWRKTVALPLSYPGIVLERCGAAAKQLLYLRQLTETILG